MNKTIFKVLPLAAVLLATSCSKDDGNVATDVVNKEPENTTPVKSATFTVSASYAPKSISKTTIKGNGAYAENIKEIFEVGDVLRLMDGTTVVATSYALTADDIKRDKSKADFTFEAVSAYSYAGESLTVVLTKDAEGNNQCANEVKTTGTTLGDVVKEYGYWKDDNTVTLEVYAWSGSEYEENIPTSFCVPEGTTFTLSQQNAFVVIPTNGVCKIGGTQYEEAGVYAIPASTNVQPLFKKEVDAVKGNVYYVPAVESRVIYSCFNDFPELDEDGYQWDKAEGDVSLEENKLKVEYNTTGVGYVRAFNSTSGKYNIYKLTVETFPDNIPETTMELADENLYFIPWNEGSSFYVGGDSGVKLTVDSNTQKVKVKAVDYGDTYIKCIDASGNVTYYKVYVPYTED